MQKYNNYLKGKIVLLCSSQKEEETDFNVASLPFVNTLRGPLKAESTPIEESTSHVTIELGPDFSRKVH